MRELCNECQMNEANREVQVNYSLGSWSIENLCYVCEDRLKKEFERKYPQHIILEVPVTVNQGIIYEEEK